MSEQFEIAEELKSFVSLYDFTTQGIGQALRIGTANAESIIEALQTLGDIVKDISERNLELAISEKEDGIPFCK